MVKIINPAKECKTTPEKFSGESIIEGIDKEDCRSSIILNSPEEFGEALRVYGGGLVKSAGATKRNLLEAVEADKGVLGAGLALIGGEINSRGFIDKLVDEAISSLKSRGRFRKDFDYDAMGTNFFKTSVEGNKVGNKYVLGLCAAYVGCKPEISLAEILEKPMALVNARAKARLSIVDNWWVNLDLEKAVENLPLPTGDLKDGELWAEYFASGGYRGKAPEFEFKYEKKNFALSFWPDILTWLKPKGIEGSNEHYMQARGKSIVGGAWTIFDETGNNQIEPRIRQPYLVFSISLPGEKYSRHPAVTSKEMKAVQDARDYIAEKIIKKQ